jgi:hypothetical protein
MKKFFYLFSFVAVALMFQSIAFSQIQITTGDLTNYFGAGKSWFQYHSSDTVMMNVGSASSSASQAWSAPSVNYQDTTRLDNVLPSSTPYNADFPGAMYAQEESISEGPVTLQNYAYYKLSNDSLLILGSVEHTSGLVSGVAIDTSIISHKVQLGFVFPLQVGNVTGFGPDTIYSSGNDVEVNTGTNTYDAFGTVTFPNGAFPALRVSGTTATKSYLSGTLANTNTSYTITWLLELGNQLEAQVDTPSSGTVKVHSVSLIIVGSTPATLVKAAPQLPSSFTLSQNYPNPFNPSTQIQFSIPQAGFVSLKVYDMLGREVATLVHQELTPSSYSITWNAANVASGVYLYRLDAGNYSVTKKMVLMK